MKEVIEKKFGENERIIASFNEGYNRARKTYGRMRTRRVEKAGEVKSCEIPISVPAEGVAGRTELWRIIKPVVDREKCNNCMSCWLHCPEGVIMETEEGVEIDYTYCKGCMVCMTVCPKNAIRSEQEVIYNV
jgi:2-oxoacid:acceptor oxidoreductase delta subunit (pyruvate/2-ketoisovalerate family)